jgi:hypothetical protein
MFGFFALLTGCVSPHAIKPPAAEVDLNKYREVRLVVTDAVKTPYSAEGLPLFRGLLKGRLERMGLKVVETNGQMVLEVKLHEFSPGDRTMRMLVGFGAGRAVLKYTARFTDDSGKLLAELEGGKSYHGMEMLDNSMFKSDESTRMGLVFYSVSQIAEYIQTNGARGAG